MTPSQKERSPVPQRTPRLLRYAFTTLLCSTAAFAQSVQLEEVATSVREIFSELELSVGEALSGRNLRDLADALQARLAPGETAAQSPA